MLVEIFLKFLICIVYIELLKVINLNGGEPFNKLSLVPLHIQVKKRGKKIWGEIYQYLFEEISSRSANKGRESIPQSFQIQRCQECQ